MGPEESKEGWDAGLVLESGNDEDAIDTEFSRTQRMDTKGPSESGSKPSNKDKSTLGADDVNLR